MPTFTYVLFSVVQVQHHGVTQQARGLEDSCAYISALRSFNPSRRPLFLSEPAHVL
jgi:hypothetical protein